MTQATIKRIFEESQVTMPENIKDKIEQSYYEAQQDRCCGLYAEPDPEGVRLSHYCLNLRVTEQFSQVIDHEGQIVSMDILDFDWHAKVEPGVLIK